MGNERKGDWFRENKKRQKRTTKLVEREKEGQKEKRNKSENK
jgi:hypothetical protein